MACKLNRRDGKTSISSGDDASQSIIPNQIQYYRPKTPATPLRRVSNFSDIPSSLMVLRSGDDSQNNNEHDSDNDQTDYPKTSFSDIDTYASASLTPMESSISSIYKSIISTSSVTDFSVGEGRGEEYVQVYNVQKVEPSKTAKVQPKKNVQTPAPAPTVTNKAKNNTASTASSSQKPIANGKLPLSSLPKLSITSSAGLPKGNPPVPCASPPKVAGTPKEKSPPGGSPKQNSLAGHPKTVVADLKNQTKPNLSIASSFSESTTVSDSRSAPTKSDLPNYPTQPSPPQPQSTISQAQPSSPPQTIENDESPSVSKDKNGAICFKLPGRIIHKTTIKVTHIPHGMAEIINIDDPFAGQVQSNQQSCGSSPRSSVTQNTQSCKSTARNSVGQSVTNTPTASCRASVTSKSVRNSQSGKRSAKPISSLVVLEL